MANADEQEATRLCRLVTLSQLVLKEKLVPDDVLEELQRAPTIRRMVRSKQLLGGSDIWRRCPPDLTSKLVRLKEVSRAAGQAAEYYRLLDEFTPVYVGEEMQVGGVKMVMPLAVKESAREARGAHLPWRSLCTGRLRLAVDNATKINGRPITREGLREERLALCSLLDTIIENSKKVRTPAGPDGLPAPLDDEQVACLNEIETMLQHRLPRRGDALRVIFDPHSDRLKVLPVSQTADLGLLNTQAIIDLLSTYPVSSLGRCRWCKRFYLPGAEGRKRSVGPRYCSEPCRRASSNHKRLKGRDTG